MPRRITVQDIADKLDDEGVFYCLIDLSPTYEFARHHLPNAVNIPLGANLMEQLPRLAPDRETPVIFYAYEPHSRLAHEAAEIAEVMGYPEVFVFEAGEREWIRKRKPLDPPR